MTATAFMPATKAIVPLAGMRWQAQTAGLPYSLAIVDGTYRFEVRGHEHCEWVGDDDARNRSELSCLGALPFGKLVTAEYDLLVAPGPVSDRPFFIPTQIHQGRWADTVTPFPASPIFALDIVPNPTRSGELLCVNADTDPKRWRNFLPYAVPFRRGVPHHIKIGFIDARGGPDGLIRVEIDGAVILDRPRITTGFAEVMEGSYWKFGIYAGISKQPADAGLVVTITNPVFAGAA